MNELELNKQLQITRKLAEKYYAKGQNDLGALILQIGSEIALESMKYIKINRRPFSCPRCHTVEKNRIGQEFIKRAGYCLLCDKYAFNEFDEAWSVYEQDAFLNVV